MITWTCDPQVFRPSEVRLDAFSRAARTDAVRGNGAVDIQWNKPALDHRAIATTRHAARVIAIDDAMPCSIQAL